MEPLFIIFAVFLVFFIFRLKITDRERIEQSGLLQGRRVYDVAVGSGRMSKDQFNWCLQSLPGGPKFYEVTYFDGEGKQQTCLCRISSSKEVEWDV